MMFVSYLENLLDRPFRETADRALPLSTIPKGADRHRDPERLSDISEPFVSFLWKVLACRRKFDQCAWNRILLETKACLARRSIKRVLDSLNTGSLSETNYFSRPVQSISNKERCFCSSMNEWMNTLCRRSLVAVKTPHKKREEEDTWRSLRTNVRLKTPSNPVEWVDPRQRRNSFINRDNGVTFLWNSILTLPMHCTLKQNRVQYI